MVPSADKPLVAAGSSHNRNWRLAELGAQDKQRVEAEQGLVFNLKLLSADPILQTTIHLRPFTAHAVEFIGGLGYSQTACGELIPRSTSRKARSVFF